MANKPVVRWREGKPVASLVRVVDRWHVLHPLGPNNKPFLSFTTFDSREEAKAYGEQLGYFIKSNQDWELGVTGL